jgi:translation elongation factor EF-Tu-like GTPase
VSRPEGELEQDYGRLEGLRARGGPHFVLRLHVLASEECGPRKPVVSNYRPQLWLGQRLASGGKLFWDCVLLVHDGQLVPGSDGDVTMVLATLSPMVLLKHEHLEFYEGSQLVATAEVRRVFVPGHPQHEQDAG